MQDVKIDFFDGFRPIQSWGCVKGDRYYFKARGSCLSLMINKSGQDPLVKSDWTLEIPHTEEPGGAGNMLLCEAFKAFESMMQRYLDGEPSGGEPGYLRKQLEAAA